MSDAKTLAWQDAEAVAVCDFIPWAEAEGATFVVTGATGLLGGSVVRALAARNALARAGIRITCLVRDLARGGAVLADVPEAKLVAWDAVADDDLAGAGGADFIVHCAAPTSSAHFVSHPVETISAVLGGTASMLEFSRRNGARMVFASSMEVYGRGGDVPLDESLVGGLDTQSPRSSYPVAKQAAEALCAAYSSEYGTPVCWARLAQSFGPGAAYGDGRVFAELARACVEGADIVLRTLGTKTNMYVYTADAASALLLLALRGDSGCAYNVANEDTLTSIRGMAEDVARAFGGGVTRVVVEADEGATCLYPPAGSLKMDVSRLRSLGWRPTVSLMGMYERLITSWREAGL